MGAEGGGSKRGSGRHGVSLPQFTAREEHVLRQTALHAIQVVSKQLQLRQRVTATAMVYFWRFYSGRPGGGNEPLAFTDCDPRIVVPAVVYLAAKTEESWVKAQYVAEKLCKLPLRFYQIGGAGLGNVASTFKVTARSELWRWWGRVVGGRFGEIDV